MVSELRDDSTFVLPGLEALNRLAPFLVHVRKQCRLVSKVRKTINFFVNF
jgi:hypothetical protein